MMDVMTHDFQVRGSGKGGRIRTQVDMVTAVCVNSNIHYIHAVHRFTPSQLLKCCSAAADLGRCLIHSVTHQYGIMLKVMYASRACTAG